MSGSEVMQIDAPEMYVPRSLIREERQPYEDFFPLSDRQPRIVVLAVLGYEPCPDVGAGLNQRRLDFDLEVTAERSCRRRL